MPSIVASVQSPTNTPSNNPSRKPRFRPFPPEKPSFIPSHVPSVLPSITPSSTPSIVPIFIPSAFPTCIPSVGPSTLTPSFQPTLETQFVVIQVIGNSTTEFCNPADENLQNVLIITIADVLAISTGDVVLRGPIEVAGQPKPFITVAYTIFFSDTIVNQTRCERYFQIIDNLLSSIRSQLFTNTLRFNAIQPPGSECVLYGNATQLPLFIQPISGCSSPTVIPSSSHLRKRVI